MTRLRELAKNETKLLESFLYEAIFIPEGVKPPGKSRHHWRYRRLIMLSVCMRRSDSGL